MFTDNIFHLFSVTISDLAKQYLLVVRTALLKAMVMFRH